VTSRLLAAFLACTFALAACTSKNAAAPSNPAPQTSQATTSKPSPPDKNAPDVQVRVVLLINGPAGTVEFVPPKRNLTNVGKNQSTPPETTDEPETPAETPDEQTTEPEAPSRPPETASTKVAEFNPGAASEYFPVKPGSELRAGTEKLMEIPAGKPGERATIAITAKTDGKLKAAGWIEKDGLVTGPLGDLELPESKSIGEAKAATVWAMGTGWGKADNNGKGFKLGTPAKGCLQGHPVTDGVHQAFSVDAGSAELAWYADEDCKEPAGAAKGIDLKAGDQAYAFPWSNRHGEPELVLVPIEKSS
jgi:hypothetical protein